MAGQATVVRRLGLAFALALAPAAGSAQVATINGPARGAAARDAAGAMSRMAADLRALIAGQDRWFVEHRRFARALRRTGEGGAAAAPSPGVKLELMYVTADSWTGRATHWAKPGKSCVVFVGQVPESRMPKTRAERLVPPREREPVCDAP